ncbi:hypothetical protein QW180_23795 [Vibrio sinaloensis]|nr:hypothetical protein [Vibrio sinaloensis]
MFKDAGYGEPSNGSVRKAIPEYLKTLTSNQTPFDKKISSQRKQSKVLICSKAKRAAPLVTTGLCLAMVNRITLGYLKNFDIFRDPMRHHTFIAFNMFMGNENYMNLKRDVGAHVQTHKADGTDMGKFMTPTLRELTQTAPYMHNGMLATLEDVVAFFITKVADKTLTKILECNRSTYPNKSKPI